MMYRNQVQEHEQARKTRGYLRLFLVLALFLIFFVFSLAGLFGMTARGVLATIFLWVLHLDQVKAVYGDYRGWFFSALGGKQKLPKLTLALSVIATLINSFLLLGELK
ncbi:hypothetical protein [Chitinimonas sp. BJB300]|uniref:hypothetical protein n=1 Tax=Chitinimonas sp. BJB300 TaxID=1559339 RepID=UPI000C0F2CCC|nr:hypothetical protein [Chitinimonas sp. BJB300]PHV09958.1 hypothetical protein CSQ89_18815 [Chitinimonas sp. BJB300]TSJ84658.1 hypothetical protein FG002_019255 [Chitinimonas sp. BJB300]